jgi:hypothetical protein
MALFSSTKPDDYLSRVQTLATEFRALQAGDTERLQRMKTYRDEMEAARVDTLVPKEKGGDYGRTAKRDGETPRHRFTFPFAQALTIKHSFRIAGRLPDAQVDRREETPEERHRSDAMEKIWWGIVRASKGDVRLAAAAHDASGLGAACLEVYWDAEAQMPHFRDVDPSASSSSRASMTRTTSSASTASGRSMLASLGGPVPRPLRGRSEAARRGLLRAPGRPNGKVCIVQMTDKNRTVRFALGYGLEQAARRGRPALRERPQLRLRQLRRDPEPRPRAQRVGLGRLRLRARDRGVHPDCSAARPTSCGWSRTAPTR